MRYQRLPSVPVRRMPPVSPQQFQLPGQLHRRGHGRVGQHAGVGKQGKGTLTARIPGHRSAVVGQAQHRVGVVGQQLGLQGAALPQLFGLGLALQCVQRGAEVLPDQQPAPQRQHQSQHRQHRQQQFVGKFHGAPSSW